jgi:phosphohistidine swiveling domain-containing protein
MRLALCCCLPVDFLWLLVDIDFHNRRRVRQPPDSRATIDGHGDLRSGRRKAAQVMDFDDTHPARTSDDASAADHGLTRPNPGPDGRPVCLAGLLDRIAGEAELVAPRNAVLAAASRDLAARLEAAPDPDVLAAALTFLAPLVPAFGGAAARTLFDLLARFFDYGADPAVVADALLGARSPGLRRQAAQLVLERAGPSLPDRVLERLDAVFDEIHGDDEDDVDTAPRARLLELVAAMLAPDDADADARRAALTARWLDMSAIPARRLAARVLDAGGAAVPADLLAAAVTDAPADLLALFEYARIGYRELADLAPAGRLPGGLAHQFMVAHGALGPVALGDLVATLGWSALAGGVRVAAPAEADEPRLVIARGGAPAALPSSDPDADAVARFRRYNVVHAELLGEILEIAPLTPARVRRILAGLDEAVALFTDLVAGLGEHVAEVAPRYQRLRAPVAAALAGVPDDQPLDAEVTRRVGMFEDPRSPAGVTTLHGLKRYLHQEGLRLSFRRFRSARSANRAVALAVVTGGRVTRTVQRIRYLDFEADRDDADAGADLATLPLPVALVVEAYGRRLLRGAADAPEIKLLVYGNEVQVFVYYRNHPAFVRLDLSPPLRGGMLDLEYYGVSQYEMDQHPAPDLPGIRRLLRRLDFDVQADGARLHIRYDKERAPDFADLVGRVRMLAALLPHLMDIDWVLGGLDYPEPVREAVADHWADWIARRGELPLDAMLTADRRYLLRELRHDPTGAGEVRWDGRGAVRHVLSGAFDQEPAAAVAPLQPDADAAVRSLAAIVVAGDDTVRRAADVAAALTPMARQLRAVDVGAINGYPVRRGRLMLPAHVLDLVTLHDADGAARLAVAWATPHRPWPLDDHGAAATEVDAPTLAAMLRRANCVPAAGDPSASAGADADRLRRLFRTPNAAEPAAAHPDDRVLPGVVAAPGRATGVAVFHRPGLTPADVDGAVLLSPALRPEDTPLLRRAAAVVSTGGGILSHAGMIALELGKPALVVAGRWNLAEARRSTLVFRAVDHDREEARHGDLPIAMLHGRRERDEEVREGDLVVVDADAGCLGILGQDRDALALQEDLAHHDRAAAALAAAPPGPGALALRGRYLRSAHQLHRLVGRVRHPGLARHAARELLAGRPARTERPALLQSLFANPACGDVARAAAVEETDRARRRLAAWTTAATDAMPLAGTPHEVLFLHRGVARAAASLAAVRQPLDSAGAPPTPAADMALDQAAHRRLQALRAEAVAAVTRTLAEDDRWPQAAAVLDHLDALAAVLGPDAAAARALADGRARALAGRQRSLARLADRLIVRPEDGGLELASLIGAKGAGLGEIARVLGERAAPRWFAVTDTALRRTLAAGVGALDPSLGVVPGTPLLLVIEQMLARRDLDLARRAAAIAAAWRTVALPADVVRAIADAYAALARDASAGGDAGRFMVAVRSSTTEEDTARSSWAGQFETYLCIRGADAVVEHVRLVWASFWSERVLAYREALADRGGEAPATPGGGVLVQQLVDSRAAGVVHTLSAVPGRPRELVLNVGLGLGEGVVSGRVEVDQVAVARDRADAASDLRFRYTVGDKRRQVVFDRTRGEGTRLDDTLYHQRLRPALEYADLADVVRASLRLEEALGRPLDLEFALAGDRLHLLQARPIVAYEEALRGPWFLSSTSSEDQREGAS